MNELSLGEYLRDLRKKKNKTTRDIGEVIGYSYSYVASIETGRRKPKEEIIEKYIYALSNNSDELLEIKKDISNITNGEYYKQYYVANIVKSDESMIEAMTSNNKVNSMYNTENSLITEKIYNFPINDISFHLSDKYNTKFFKNIKLSDEDRNYMNTIFYNHLKQKYDYKLIDVTNRINEKMKTLKKLKEEGLTDQEIFVREDLSKLHGEEFEVQRVLSLLERPMSYFE
ncbi:MULTISPECIES: helix-turn-helix domain-containing protein [Staphylococcus]|uniref:helix-turn-helix domain-containing protein n=1 Tax=Staphylococcus TaxID=1279 RepID=UPI000D1D8920|nr:helix-turn-helix transcriptional regulator [Staphylococcus saprophyticus]PTJ66852.1 XRE family transcriptional regulator [Staphylococcus saprophyticus]